MSYYRVSAILWMLELSPFVSGDHVDEFRAFLSSTPSFVELEFTYTDIPGKELRDSFARDIENYRSAGINVALMVDQVFHFQVRMQKDGFLLRRADNSESLKGFELSAGHVGFGFVSNMFWRLSDANRALTLDFDIASSVSSERFLAERGEQLAAAAHQLELVRRLGFPTHHGRPEWTGNRFTYESSDAAASIVEGELVVTNGTPVEAHYIERWPNQPDIHKEVTVHYRFARADGLFPLEFDVNQRIAGGDANTPTFEGQERVTIGRVEVGDSALEASAYSPRAFIDANTNSIRVDVITNNMVYTIFEKGQWVPPDLQFGQRAQADGRIVRRLLFSLLTAPVIVLIVLGVRARVRRVRRFPTMCG
jgi:hypothetical protein